MENKKMKRMNEFYRKLEAYMKNVDELNIKKIYSMFPKTNPKTLSWRLYELVQQGKIHRTGHGYYALKNMDDHNAVGYDYIHEKSKTIFNIVAEYGFEYYITGIDSLFGEILHLPEKYPVLLVVEKAGIEEIKDSIGEKGFIALTENEKSMIYKTNIKKAVDVIILKGKDFSLATDNIAKKEKGFVDLYYAVTRMEYSISIPETSRIFSSMQRNRSIATRVMKKAARDRGLMSEVTWLLELDKLSQKAVEFMHYQIERTI